MKYPTGFTASNNSRLINNARVEKNRSRYAKPADTRWRIAFAVMSPQFHSWPPSGPPESARISIDE